MTTRLNKKIRYAVVGLGHIAQVAVLPAFRNASRNSELVALVSGDGEKLRALGKKYGVDKLYSYAEYEDCLRSGEVDAVYIATPNPSHRHYAEAAAKYGVHVLCEKPLAVTPEDCEAMIVAARQNHVRLMTAYRLHFEAANLAAVKLAASKARIGDLKVFNSVFTMQVKDRHNIRLENPERGGGTLYDIGIYCINAARYLFQAEPVEVFALSTNSGDPRFHHVDEITSAILHFPHARLASFTTSFGAHSSADYDLLGSQGRIRLENAYEYAETMDLRTWQGDKLQSHRKFGKRDQFGPELLYFSDCILKNRDPEPSGLEGLADVRIIEALLESAETGRMVAVAPLEKDVRPNEKQVITQPGFRKPKVFHATEPGEGG